ncbi:sensor histidine kinase [Streptomyces sp. B15]|uniref:sensor histidine kinase n=1 Tax=Streptomyces sp. B15 TaxID=1537797 RepID=UPI001B36D64B|nr:histidine kinase [Streptomyces sp. B15]MBQ1124937.1 two-component sensor histidine kinase [Streptomyces sp. B15]
MSDQTRTAKAAAPAETETALVFSVLKTVHQDLFEGAFASRPLPPRPEPRPGDRLHRLPAGIRHRTRWTPHALVGATAMFAFLIGLAKGMEFGSLGGAVTFTTCCLAAVPIALVLLRPVGAYWISYSGVLLSLLHGQEWAMLSLLCHVVVMVLVVLRTRPRLAAEMWSLTLLSGSLLSALRPGTESSDLPQFAVASAVLLVAAGAVRAWRQERRHVVASETVKEQERAQRTVLEERATIARELHDVVAHHMSVIAIQAEAAPYRVDQTPPELATSFATIRENAVAALTELRRILGVVRSGDPDPFAETDPEAPQPTLADLDTLLESVCSTGLDAEAVVTGAVRPLPQGVELSAYRLVQEALSNVLRHSPGASARVEVAYVLGGLGLRIVNGSPDRPATPSPGAGHGVLGMRERVQVLGGEMTAGPTDDGGYEVAAFLPVHTPASGSSADGGVAAEAGDGKEVAA